MITPLRGARKQLSEAFTTFSAISGDVTPAPAEMGGDDLPGASCFLLNHDILKCMDAIYSMIPRRNLAESEEMVQSFLGSNVEVSTAKAINLEGQRNH